MRGSNIGVPISGMTCRACEQRVAKAIKKVPGVKSVQVSLAKGRAFVVTTEEFDEKVLAAAVAKAGYQVGQDSRPLLSKDRKVWTDLALAVAAVAVLVLAWNLLNLERVGTMLSARATGGNLVFVVLLGVAASISTCMALVGGIVLSLSSSFAQSYPQASGRKLLRPQLMFNAGRIVGFAVLGALIGLVGQVVSLQGVWLGAMMLLVALVMGWLGLRLTGISPKLSAVSLTLSPALTKWVFTEGGGYRDTNALLLGAASFFLPCGFTQAVQVYALSTGDWLQAGLVMALFAVGTTPGLLGVGALSALAEGEKATRVFHFVGVAVIGFAVLNFVAGIHAIAPNVGAPNVAAPPAQVATSVTPSAIPTGDGFQQVTTTVAAGYSPADAVVQAGVPVKWTLDVQALGCASTISAAQLGIAEPIYLDVGTNSVEFTLSQPGTYQYSCAMGMYWGSFTAV